MPVLAGHADAWREWRGAMARQRMHHGWLLAGREGLGKASFALAAAAELVAQPGGSAPPPRLHPDILLLEPLPASEDDAKKRDEGRPFQRRRNITVEQVRDVQRRLVTRPTLGSRRAVIIDAADQLEKGAVNALLKSLEEPPQGTVFLLVVHQIGRLLPTIRSRCTVLRFHPLSDADLAGVLDSAGEQIDAPTRAAAIGVAAGSPGAALAFAGLDLARPWSLMERIVCDGDPDGALRAELAAAAGARPDRERLAALLEAARMALASVLSRAPGDLPGDTAMRLPDLHARLVELAAQAPTYNFDPGLLMMEIGALLASVAPTRERSR